MTNSELYRYMNISEDWVLKETKGWIEISETTVDIYSTETGTWVARINKYSKRVVSSNTDIADEGFKNLEAVFLSLTLNTGK